MNKGKSLTWIKYATTLYHNYGVHLFDYVAKAVSDTMVFPDRFLRWTMEHPKVLQYPHNQRMVYGGYP
jgi:hypothetical protein